MIPQPPSTLLPHAFNSLLPDSPAFSFYSSCTEMLDCGTIFPRRQFHHAMSLLRNSPLVPNSHLIRSHLLGLAFQLLFHYLWASLVAQTVKNPPAMQKTRDQTPGWEDPLEKGMAAHTSILAWRIPWAEEPGGLQSMGLQTVRHNWTTDTFTFTFSIISGLLTTSWIQPPSGISVELFPTMNPPVPAFLLPKLVQNSTLH